MKAIILCPAVTPGSAFFTQQRPLALCPLLGRSALDRTLADLAKRGARDITILADDRPHEIRAAVGDGRAWGLRRIEVIAVNQDQAMDKARALRTGDGWLPAPHDIAHILPWPDEADGARWPDPSAWFQNIFHHLADAGNDSVGMREILPGVWVGTRARISPSAVLRGPCWIGHNAVIAPNAVIGPRAVIEEGAFIDEAVEVADSFVGPATFAGAYIEIRKSLAWGRHLLNWGTGSLTEITDTFLLGDMHQRLRMIHGYWIGRLTALIVMLLTSPILLVAWFRAKAQGVTTFKTRRVVRAPVSLDSVGLNTTRCSELNAMTGLWRRWPELWKITTGHFEWIGNRPLTPEQCTALTSEFERLWLSVPPGLISLADAVGCWEEPFGDEARAHAAFYAAKAGWRAEALVLSRWMRRAIGRRLAKLFTRTASSAPQTQPS